MSTPVKTVAQLRSYIARLIESVIGHPDLLIAFFVIGVAKRYDKETDVRTLEMWWRMLKAIKG